VRGVRVRIAGLINMHQTVLDLEPVPDARAGDEVVLLGAQGDARVLAEERVPDGGSVYEITCGLPQALPRAFVPGHEVHGAVAERDPARAVLPRDAAAHPGTGERSPV
jgi:hypothetical protein